MLPLILAGAIWTYNICKIVERAGSTKPEDGGNHAEDEDNKESNDGKEEDNITISNSSEAIKFYKNQQKTSGLRSRNWSGGERYGK